VRSTKGKSELEMSGGSGVGEIKKYISSCRRAAVSEIEVGGRRAICLSLT
jgi:hypothetical protein